MVVEPKSVCPKYSEARPMGTSKFQAEKGLLITEAPAWKVGDPDWSQIHLADWLGCKIAKGKRGGEGLYNPEFR